MFATGCFSFARARWRSKRISMSALRILAMAAAPTALAYALAERVAPELGNLTASAVLGWFAWYTATRTVPGMLRSFRDEMNAARQDFRSDTAALRDQLACEREYRHRDNAAIARALNRLSRATARFETRRADSSESH
jgi:hypothetical protein